MTIIIRADILAQAGLAERDARIEFACRLYDADRLRMRAASRLAGLDRVQFEVELRKRRIPDWRPTADAFAADAAEVRRLRKGA
jgi:predicted HTH domain antitoxin